MFDIRNKIRSGIWMVRVPAFTPGRRETLRVLLFNLRTKQFPRRRPYHSSPKVYAVRIS